MTKVQYDFNCVKIIRADREGAAKHEALTPFLTTHQTHSTVSHIHTPELWSLEARWGEVSCPWTKQQLYVNWGKRELSTLFTCRTLSLS